VPPVSSANSVPLSDHQYSALIRPTEYGIPHILASNFGGVGYGYGYAFAQDNICTLEQQVLTDDGSRSVNLGPSADSGDPLNGAVSNLDSDFYYRSVNDSGVVEHLVRQPAPLGPMADVRQLVAGYAAGVTRYLKITGVKHISDPSCRGRAWVRAISDLDVYRILYNLSQTGGLDSVKPLIAEAKPGTPTPALLSPIQPSQFGSNAIAVGREATQNGHGLLLANPHFRWAGDRRFYQVQLTVAGRLNVSGASLYGTPMVEIGHTEHLAWTHTVSTAQRFTATRPSFSLRRS
jgi:acyl-homoserine-lactone acylase